MATRRKATNKQPAVLTLRISLAESLPEIWREVVVTAQITLAQLHRVIQTVMPWDDSAEHSFVDREGKVYTRHLETTLLKKLLTTPRSKITYQYDPENAWDHVVELIRKSPAQTDEIIPRCTAGQRTAPPQGCGGVWGYAEVLAALKDPKHSLHRQMIDYMGENFDPAAFDLVQVNERLTRLTPA